MKNVSQKFAIQRKYCNHCNHTVIKILSQTQLETELWRESSKKKLEGKLLIQAKAVNNLKI